MKISLFISLLFFVQLASAESLNQLEDRLLKRYADFYTRLNDNNKKKYQTKRAREQKRQQRLEEEKRRVVTRKAFRRPVKAVGSDELHKRELEAQRKKREAGRAEYISEKKRVQQVKDRLQVPEWVEYELYDGTLVSDSPAKSSN